MKNPRQNIILSEQNKKICSDIQIIFPDSNPVPRPRPLAQTWLIGLIG